MKFNKANYSFFELIGIVRSLIITKICYPGARLIRKGTKIRGKKAITYRTGLTIGYGGRVEINGNLHSKKLIIGNNCVIGDYVHIVANFSVTIGDNVLMASRVFITDTNHGSYNENGSDPTYPPVMRPLSYAKVIIGNNVWIGENVSILPGVTVGNGCIIGANTVITKSLEDNCIVVGSPGKVIKRWDTIEKKWIKTV